MFVCVCVPISVSGGASKHSKQFRKLNQYRYVFHMFIYGTEECGMREHTANPLKYNVHDHREETAAAAAAAAAIHNFRYKMFI